MSKKKKKAAVSVAEIKAKKRRRRKVLWRLFLVLEIIILAALSVVAYGVYKYTMIDTTELDTSSLEVYQDTGDFTNIALFGLDSREGELEGGIQSDCIMVVSIDNTTYEMNLVSVYRDTLLKQADDTYEKANYAYNAGGPQDAVAMLNRNLDLDIEKYISVNFNALADVIDALGGVEIELTEEEVFWTNGYCTETSQVVGRQTTELQGAGVHNLDGIQAVSYARIRYTEGDDFKRTERQRTVLKKVVEKAQQADFVTLNRIIDAVFPKISTNLTISNLLGMAANAKKYQLGETSGFPFEVDGSENIIGHEGSYVIPVNLMKNVKELHKFLFGNMNYIPSDKVKQISDDIIYLSGIGYEYSDDMGIDNTYTEDIYNEDFYIDEGYSEDIYNKDPYVYEENLDMSSGYEDETEY